MAARASTRGSGTRAIPTLVSVVEKGWAATATVAPVRALNRLDLPAFGKPTRPRRSMPSRVVFAHVETDQESQGPGSPQEGQPRSQAEQGPLVAPGPAGATTVEHLVEHGRPVRHDAVTPESDQPVHLIGIIDGPYVHRNAVTVGRGH